LQKKLHNLLSEVLQKGGCDMRTSHNICFSSEEDSALKLAYKPHKYFS